MLEQALKTNLHRFRNFIGFAMYFCRRNFRVNVLFGSIIEGVKEYFTLLKKRKMAYYRVDYQRYRLDQMEKLIADNNNHAFLTGQKLNDVR